MAEGDRTRYLLAWFESKMISPANLTPVRREIEDQIDLPREQVEIDVWLESPGGDAHSAFKLALMLRHAASRIRVVVPDYAKSAATLLSLAGDEIFLAPGAELGPLDAQMPEEGSYSGYISALNIARAADEVARDALEMAVVGGADLLAITGLSRAQTLEVVLGFSAEFSKPLVCQLDPKLVHHAKQMLLVTAKYAEQLLTLTGCRNADEVAHSLVENFPTHGYVIAYEEAKKLGLPVRPLVEYEFLDGVRSIHRASEEGLSLIEFGLMSELLEPTTDEADADDQSVGAPDISGGDLNSDQLQDRQPNPPAEGGANGTKAAAAER